MIKIRKGLNLPITGEPEQTIHDGPQIGSVALVGYDYHGMKPTMLVKEGDTVKLGQPLFSDKKIPAVQFTSPGSGKVISVNRGKKRVFQSIIIELSGDEEQTFTSYGEKELDQLNCDQVKELLLQSGQWTSLRARPFSKLADPGQQPHALFITAIDTNPLAPSVELIVKENEAHFRNGLKVVSKLAPKTFLCKAPGAEIAGSDFDFITTEEFAGPHPAGNVGTHIHFLDPVSENHIAWYLNYQDVIAIGKLFTSGRICVERIVAIAGPVIKKPRLVRTRLGASTDDLVKDQLQDGDNRIISGSVLSGRTTQQPVAFLGRYHLQVSALREGREREMFGWMAPGFNKYSIKNLFASKLLPWKKFDLTTSTNGSPRAIVPIEAYESVMPLDIIPTFLLRALASNDTEQAQALGCLELDEEDLALCTFVCPGKHDFGTMLRRNLLQIEKEG